MRSWVLSLSSRIYIFFAICLAFEVDDWEFRENKVRSKLFTRSCVNIFLHNITFDLEAGKWGVKFHDLWSFDQAHHIVYIHSIHVIFFFEYIADCWRCSHENARTGRAAMKTSCGFRKKGQRHQYIAHLQSHQRLRCCCSFARTRAVFINISNKHAGALSARLSMSKNSIKVVEEENNISHHQTHLKSFVLLFFWCLIHEHLAWLFADKVHSLEFFNFFPSSFHLSPQQKRGKLLSFFFFPLCNWIKHGFWDFRKERVLLEL